MATFTLAGVTYEIIRGSDVERDGMYLEVSEIDTTPVRQLAEVFYSDVTHQFSVSCFEEGVPMELIEELIRRARVALPAVGDAQPSVPADVPASPSGRQGRG